MLCFRKFKALEYKNELESLKNKVALAESLAPRERAAQRIANKAFSDQVKKFPNLFDTREKKNKLKDQLLSTARIKTGRISYDKDTGLKNTHNFKITDQEWKAMSNGGVSSSLIRKIYNHADSINFKQMATPKASKILSPNTKARIRAMKSKGYTASEISESLGVSIKTIRENSQISNVTKKKG